MAKQIPTHKRTKKDGTRSSSTTVSASQRSQPRWAGWRTEGPIHPVKVSRLNDALLKESKRPRKAS